MLYFRDMTHQEFQDYVRSQGRRLYRPMLWREQPTFYDVAADTGYAGARKVY